MEKRVKIPKTDYSKIAKYYDRVRSRGGIHDGGWKKVAEFGNIKKAKFVLDVGCGTGGYNIAYQKKYIARFVGLDRSRDMLFKAATKNRKHNVDWIVGNAESLPFKSGIFDLVYMTFVIHHVENKEKAIREFRRILKNRGYIVIMTSSHARLHRTPWSMFPGVYAIDSKRFPTIPELRKIILSARYNVVQYHRVIFGRQKLSFRRAMKNANAKFISTFTLIPDNEYAKGLKIFEKRIKSRYDRTIDRILEADFLVAQK